MDGGLELPKKVFYFFLVLIGLGIAKLCDIVFILFSQIEIVIK